MSVVFEFADPKALLAIPNGGVRVDVTASDMAQGEQFQSCSCPVALALSRQFGIPRWNIVVASDAVMVRDNSGRVMRWWRMDDDGCAFRLFWDAGQRNQQPASFTLIPQPVPYMDAYDVFRLPIAEEAVAA